MVETVEKYKVVDSEVDGQELRLVLESSDRADLMDNGRKYCIEHVSKTPEFTTWSQGGVEYGSGPIATDPVNPDMDTQEAKELADKEGRTVNWVFRQIYRVTKMI